MSLAKFTAKKLSKSQVSRLRSDLVGALSHLPGLQKMILFGSAVDGRMTEASDLDVVLVFESPKTARAGFKEAQLAWKGRWPADFLCVDALEFEKRARIGGVLCVAKREGISIFGRLGR